jgi:hypothetical protein
MKAVIRRLLRRFDSEETKREIEEELCFHLDLLTQDHLQENLSSAEARGAALKRFGNVQLIKDECLEISSRRHPLISAMKSFLIAVFLVGVLIRVNSTEPNVTHLGDLLIAVPILGRLFFYVRGLNPSRFLSDHKTTSPLKLNETGQPPFTIYDRRKLTPLERVIFDK